MSLLSLGFLLILKIVLCDYQCEFVDACSECLPITSNYPQCPSEPTNRACFDFICCLKDICYCCEQPDFGPYNLNLITEEMTTFEIQTTIQSVQTTSKETLSTTGQTTEFIPEQDKNSTKMIESTTMQAVLWEVDKDAMMKSFKADECQEGEKQTEELLVYSCECTFKISDSTDTSLETKTEVCVTVIQNHVDLGVTETWAAASFLIHVVLAGAFLVSFMFKIKPVSCHPYDKIFMLTVFCVLIGVVISFLGIAIKESTESRHAIAVSALVMSSIMLISSSLLAFGRWRGTDEIESYRFQ